MRPLQQCVYTIILLLLMVRLLLLLLCEKNTFGFFCPTKNTRENVLEQHRAGFVPQTMYCPAFVPEKPVILCGKKIITITDNPHTPSHNQTIKP